MYDDYSFEDLVSALEAAGCQVHGRSYKCAWHGDKTSSGSIFERNGKWRARCHVCGETKDLYDIVGKEHVAVRSNPKPVPKKEVQHWPSLRRLVEDSIGRRRVYRVYLYSGSFAVIRTQEKKFRQVHKDNQGWRYGGIPNPPLFGSNKPSSV